MVELRIEEQNRISVMFFQRNILSENSSLVKAGTSYRQGSGENRCDWMVEMGGRWIFPKQVHGNWVWKVDESVRCEYMSECMNDGLRTKGERLQGDALVTQEKGVVLGIETADCLPIFLLDEKTKAIGLVHAGWRGTEKRILQKAIQVFQREFFSLPSDLWISFGPGIRSCCYEVQGELEMRFDFVFLREGKYFLDLFKENREQALGLGVLSEKILEESGLCTSCNTEYFFSFRKEREKAKRMVSFIVLS